MRTCPRRSLLVLALLAPGCGAAEPAPSADETSGDDVIAEPAPEPSPPPEPARVRIVHAAPGPAAATISVGFDGAEPAITDLTFHNGSAYVELPVGPHELLVRGVPSVETGDAAELARAPIPELTSERHYATIVHGLAGEEPELTATSLEERVEPPAEGAAGARLFHALIGAEVIDACLAGASPRDPATSLFPATHYGTLGSSDGEPYADLPAEGELALQLRAPHATPCRGRLLGVARTALTPGTNHTLVLAGRTSGRPRVERELIVCTEGESASCIAVPITAR